MEKLEFYIDTSEPELIKMFNSMTYEEKLQLYELDKEILESENDEYFKLKEMARDILEEKGINRKDWFNFRIMIKIHGIEPKRIY